MMADKKSAAELVEAMENNTAVSKRTQRALSAALGSKKLADEMLAKIASPAQISEEAEQILDIAAASEETGKALEDEIES